jgi:rod shape-determining protein MreB
MLLSHFLRLPGQDLAIDLGTANTVVHVKGRGITSNEPSAVSLETKDGVRTITAVGSAAKVMLGKTSPATKIIRPLRGGVIVDVEVAEQMIKHFVLESGSQSFLRRPREIVICAPSTSTGVERRAIRDAASSAGASKVWLIDQAMAAALGAGLPVREPFGTMVVNIGAGKTEVAVFSLCGTVFGTSLRLGGDKMDKAIAAYVRRKYNLVIGEMTAERLKRSLAVALEAEVQNTKAPVRGRHLSSGLPREIAVSQHEVWSAIQEFVSQIIGAVRTALESTPPEFAGDVMDRGIVLTGGGALLPQIDTAISLATQLPVRVADDPELCVARGAAKAMEDSDYRQVLASG